MFKDTNDADEHACDQSDASERAAAVTNTRRQPASGAVIATACRYDWNASTEGCVDPQDERSVIDRVADAYRRIEDQAVRALPFLRKLALPGACAVVLAGLGVGTTLLYDPPAISVEPPSFASIEARAEPGVASKDDPRSPVTKGMQAPRMANAAVAAVAPPPAVSDKTEMAQARPVQPDHTPFPLVDDVANAGGGGSEMAYMPDSATTTGSIPAAVIEAAVKDTRKAPEAAQPAAAMADADDSGRTAHVKMAVNMRASPKKGAKVLTVVPAKASVNVIECKSWCRIAFNGQEGWVYKSFVR